MKPTARDIAQAAIDSAFEMLEANGLGKEAGSLPRLLREAAAAREGAIVATIATPTGDAGALKDHLLDVLKKRFGTNVSIEEKKDSSLLGGAVITYGDERIDVSVKGALTSAKSALRDSSVS